MKKINIVPGFCAAMLLLLFLPAMAGVEPTLSQRKQAGGHLKVDTIIEVQDDKYTCIAASSCSPSFTTTRLDGAVVLGIDHDTLVCVDSFAITFGLQITYYDISSPSTPQTENIQLRLVYDPKAGRLTDDKAIYRRTNAVWLKAKITSITSTLAMNAVPANVYIEALLEKERYYAFNCASTPSSLSLDTTLQEDQIVISWASVSGAEEYDLEWVYIDDFKDDAGATNDYYSASQLEYDFTNNATRITVNTNSFVFRNIYEHGYLLFRVRAVGAGGTDFAQRLEAAWSSDGYSGNDVSDFTLRYFNHSGHEASLNWQWTNTFAEEGKYKTVISYADGTLRGRQVVTAMHTEQLAIVGESFYDHVGRKAVDALPVPTGESVIKYYVNFNLSDVSGDPYSWKDFDTSNAGDACENLISGMSTDAGASRYYSPDNPDQNFFQAYVPNAFKYPFTVTEYMPDNTGRIRRQGGIGTNHQLGSGHETQYFYGTPSQWELDRLFGNEAGDFRRYKKNMVVDANGTVSISYINARGAVIATSLAGESPENLQTLDTTGARDTAIIDLTQNSIIDPFSMKIMASYSLLLSTSSVVTLDYKLLDNVYSKEGCGLDSICFDCAYDLKIFVMGECGDTLHKWVEYGIHPFDTSCVNDSFTHSHSLYLGRGSYSIYKELRVNTDALDRYTDIYIEKNTCIPSVDSIYADLLEQIDFSGCLDNCDSCIEKLGTLQEFFLTQVIKYEVDTTDTELYDSLKILFTEDYMDQQADCKLLCNEYIPCQTEKMMLMQDVTPGGQYFTYYQNDGGAYFPGDVLSFGAETAENNHTDYEGETRNWQNPAIVYHDDNGEESFIWYNDQWTRPNDLPLDVFLSNWRGSWSEDLIVMHPEYCYYKFCLENDTSNFEDEVMVGVNTFQEAEDDSLLNTVGADVLSYPEKTDNYFKTGKLGASQLSAMQARMTAYAVQYGNTYDIYQAAAVMASCPYAASADEINDCLVTHPFGSGSDELKDKQWNFYKQLYLGVKQELMDARRTEYATDSSCRNCYIASGGYLRPDSCNTGDTAFRRKERLFLSTLAATKMDLSQDIDNIMARGRFIADSAIASQCDLQCEAYADRWMLELANCELDSADSVAIRQGLISVCRDGCDSYNPLGASEVSPQNRSTADYLSFSHVLEDVLGPGFRTRVCNEDLITWPSGYNHSYIGEDAIPADSCFMAGFVSRLESVYGCNNSLELNALRTILSSLNDSGLLKTNDNYVPLDDSNLDETALDNYTDFIRPHILVDEGQSDFYRSKLIDIGAGTGLEGWFVGVDGEDKDSCKFVINTPAGRPASIFDSIASFDNITHDPDSFDLFCNRNYESGAFLITVTLLDESVVTLKANSTCFAMCFNPGEVNAASLSEYYMDTYCVDLDTTTIKQVLQYLCDSLFLPYVPRELSCKPRCITCDRFFVAREDFFEKYDSIYFLSDSASEQRGFDTAYASYLNAALGMNLTAEDYLQFGENCDTFYKTSIYRPNEEGGTILNPYTYSRYIKVKNGCDTTLPSLVQDTLFNLLSMCDRTVDEVLLPDTNPCIAELKASALYNAQQIYQRYVDSLRADFRSQYINKCLGMVGEESFTLRYDVKEYHFTLYYYDQAGNLVKTVPPKGVDLLTSPAEFAAVTAYRADPGGMGTTFTVPTHTYVTNYKYTTLEQVWEQTTPDGGTSYFFYDHLGRLAVSQNEKQEEDSLYSYTKYDELGRINEVGELKASTLLTFSNAKTEAGLAMWFMSSTDDYTQITHTTYEEPSPVPLPLGEGQGLGLQENLRNRVSFITYDDDGNGINEYASYYTYDIHGNVKTLLHQYDDFTQVNGGFFRIDYTYDLISGNVHRVSYQEGKQDQFFHKYLYDADNRLTHAYTSRDKLVWDNDAQYFYYQHGPLARVEVGQLKVQGMDYAYTIHGWLKGVNSGALDSVRDIGMDAWNDAGNIHRYIPKDLYGFTLGYYQGDYHDIAELSAAEHFEIQCAGGDGIDAASSSLFNGNIRHMVTAISKFMEAGPYIGGGVGAGSTKPIATAYRYDQLNRLLDMYVYDSINMSTNTWHPVSNPLSAWHNRFTYDANGNIITQVRHGSLTAGLAMDSLNYSYTSATNRLDHVDDVVSGGAYSDDIDDQGSANYTYDAIGNLVSDASEQIASITWNVYGKIRSITRSGGSRPRLDFAYGPGGHRLSKKATYAGDSVVNEYYVRDAQGNILATYSLTDAFFVTIDSSYTRVIERLVDSMGIGNFASFMASRFSGNSTFYTALGNKRPDQTLAATLVSGGIASCIGDRIFGEIFACCDVCSETNNRKLFSDFVNDANSADLNLASILMQCKPEQVLEGIIKKYGSDFIDAYKSGGGVRDMYIFFKLIYPQFQLDSVEYLRLDVPVGDLAWYMAYKLPTYYGAGNPSMYNTYILELTSGMGFPADSLNEMIRKFFSPCKFLECMRSCFSYEDDDLTIMGACSNNFTANLSSRFSTYINPRNPEPNLTSVRSSIASHTWTTGEFNTVASCDPAALLLAMLKYDANGILSDYASNFGSLTPLVNYFLPKYPYPDPGSPPTDINYLIDIVPAEELAWYIPRYSTPIPPPGSFLSWLQATYGGLFNNGDVQTILGTHYADCDIKKCITGNSIIGSPGFSVPMASWFAANRKHLILSAGDICDEESYEGLISRSSAYCMGRKAVICSEDMREDMLLKYPYFSLISQAIDDDKAALLGKLMDCDYGQLFKSLLYTAGTEFLSEIESNSPTTISDAYTFFTGTYLDPGSNTDVDYLLRYVPADELADWFEGQNYDYSADAAALADALVKKAIKEHYTECSFKNCMLGWWIDSTVTINFNDLLPWYKENYWTSIMDETYSCAPDTFTYHVAYKQRALIAEILEDWHYPLKDFMAQVDSFFGDSIADWLNGDTLRNYQYARLNELHMYGSSRLGVLNVNDTVYGGIRLYNFDLSVGDTTGGVFAVEEISYYVYDSMYTLKRGDRHYEGSNHLSNVLVVFTDKRIAQCSSGIAYKYHADLIQAQHYSAFGAPMPGLRWYANSTDQYKFGFNGKEEDDEVKGNGCQQDYGMRGYDNRLGRFLSVDPLEADYPWYTPYQFAGNTSIWAIDLDGLEELLVTDKANSDGTYERKYELNPDEKVRERDKGKVKHTYSDATVSEIMKQDEKEKIMAERLKNADKQYKIDKAAGKQNTGTAKSIRQGLPGPTTKPISTPKPKPHPKPLPGPKPSKVKPKGGPIVKSTPVPASPPKPAPAVLSSKGVTLDIPFISNEAEFEDEAVANSQLDPIRDLLLKDPRNTAWLHPGTAYSKNEEKGVKLLHDRGDLLMDWFISRGVNPKQVRIVIDDSNYSTEYKVIGNIFYFSK